jgi:ribosomal protein L30
LKPPSLQPTLLSRRDQSTAVLLLLLLLIWSHHTKQWSVPSSTSGPMGQDQVIKTFFVTLRRSQAGKPYFHRRVLDALGLTKRLACVEKPNSPVIRGMLRKVGQ